MEWAYKTSVLHRYDSTHIAAVNHYRSLTFGTFVYHHGDFIEETFGVAQRNDIMQQGMAAHATYGTYHLLCYGSDGAQQPAISHLNGVRFLTPEQRVAKGYPAHCDAPSRVMVHRSERRLKNILDSIIRFAGICEELDRLKNILSIQLNAARIRGSVRL